MRQRPKSPSAPTGTVRCATTSRTPEPKSRGPRRASEGAFDRAGARLRNRAQHGNRNRPEKSADRKLVGVERPLRHQCIRNGGKFAEIHGGVPCCPRRPAPSALCYTAEMPPDGDDDCLAHVRSREGQDMVAIRAFDLERKVGAIREQGG